MNVKTVPVTGKIRRKSLLDGECTGADSFPWDNPPRSNSWCICVYHPDKDTRNTCGQGVSCTHTCSHRAWPSFWHRAEVSCTDGYHRKKLNEQSILHCGVPLVRAKIQPQKGWNSSQLGRGGGDLGTIWQCVRGHFWLSQLGGRMLLASSGWRPRLLLKTAACTRRLPQWGTVQPQMSTALRLRNPSPEQCLLPFWFLSLHLKLAFGLKNKELWEQR